MSWEKCILTMRVCEMLVIIWRPFSRHCTDVTFIGIFVITVDVARCTQLASALLIVEACERENKERRERGIHTGLSFYATHPQLFMYKGMHDRTDAETCFFVFSSLSVILFLHSRSDICEQKILLSFIKRNCDVLFVFVFLFYLLHIPRISNFFHLFIYSYFSK